MTSSVAKIAANQSNAQKSTGPTTVEGKARVSTNAVSHGLFSKRLVLQDEDPVEYQTLLDQLMMQIQPVGILEQSLVERIAVSLWRQKRLIKAETAQLELLRTDKQIVSAVNHELELYNDQRLYADDLVEFDEQDAQWSQAVLHEYTQLQFHSLQDLPKLRTTAPLIFAQLVSDAEDDETSPEEFLGNYTQPMEYFMDLAQYCRDQLRQARLRPLVLKVADLVRDKRSLLPDKPRETLSKYQVMLDNELHKTLKALREAQEWRLKSLTVANDSGFVLEAVSN